jgi:hypothetical protein
VSSLLLELHRGSVVDNKLSLHLLKHLLQTHLSFPQFDAAHHQFSTPDAGNLAWKLLSDWKGRMKTN